METTLVSGIQEGQKNESGRITMPPVMNGTVGAAESSAPLTLRELCAAAEIAGISRALAQTGWNRRRAAKLLSISYRGLLYKIRQYNITPETRG